jgi:hypothetical protein
VELQYKVGELIQRVCDVFLELPPPDDMEWHVVLVVGKDGNTTIKKVTIVLPALVDEGTTTEEFITNEHPSCGFG